MRLRVHFEGAQRLRMALKSEIKLEISGQPTSLRSKPQPEIVRSRDNRKGSVDEIGVVLQTTFLLGGLEQSRINACAHALRTSASRIVAHCGRLRHEAVRRRIEVTGVVRRRRWTDREKGRIVAEAIASGAVIADVTWRHDLTPQHLWNWIRAARQGRFVLPDDGMAAFVPVLPEEASGTNEPAPKARSAAIEIVIGAVTVRVPTGSYRRFLVMA